MLKYTSFLHNFSFFFFNVADCLALHLRPLISNIVKITRFDLKLFRLLVGQGHQKPNCSGPASIMLALG